MERAIGDFAGVCVASVCVTLPRVTQAICTELKTFKRLPNTEEEMRDACRGFYSIASFPLTIGAIDCTHVKIRSPGGATAENYRNRKGYFSLNVQTICSADLRVIDVIARWPGATHDQTIFNNSAIKFRFESGQFGRYILVGDGGYKNTKYLATPLLNPVTRAETLYNESQVNSKLIHYSFNCSLNCSVQYRGQEILLKILLL